MKGRAPRLAPRLERPQASQPRAGWHWQGAQHCMRLQLAPKMCCVRARAALRAKRLLSACAAAHSQGAARSQEMYQGISATIHQRGLPPTPSPALPGPSAGQRAAGHGGRPDGGRRGQGRRRLDGYHFEPHPRPARRGLQRAQRGGRAAAARHAAVRARPAAPVVARWGPGGRQRAPCACRRFGLRRALRPPR